MFLVLKTLVDKRSVIDRAVSLSEVEVIQTALDIIKAGRKNRQ